MLKRTHLAIGFAAALYFLPHMKNKAIFLSVVILATLLPDIDSGFSTLGKNKIFRPLQMLVHHRGVIHSYTVCIPLTILLSFYYPILAFPFFLGYSFHLFADSFTNQGIRPLWPLKFSSSGKIVTGGRIESAVFFTLLIVDAALLVKLFI
ncbi:MAG: metal-dependent hydrolase [Nanoarchaeota archaeon]